MLLKSITYRSTRIARQTIQFMYRWLHRFKLPKMNTTQARIVESLRSEGAYITTIDELALAGFPNTKECFESSNAAINQIEIEEDNPDENFVVHISGKQLMEHSEILRWGLNEAMLTIIENYLGLPPVFRGTSVQRNLANKLQTESRFWHLDSLDTRIITVIIYLKDVGTNDGPFTYIPLSAAKNHKFKTFNGSRVTDQNITKKVPISSQIECTGPAGTVVFVDNCSAWHRGKTGTDKNRDTSFFVYHSSCPLVPEMAMSNYSAMKLMEQHPDLTKSEQRALSNFK